MTVADAAVAANDYDDEFLRRDNVARVSERDVREDYVSE